MSLSLKQKIEILEFYLQRNKSASAARAEYCTAKGEYISASLETFSIAFLVKVYNIHDQTC
jgi:hypothetical protein